jgi:hypothetical protein
MRPGDPFSQNEGPPWTPLVWRIGSGVLVAQAQQALWSDQRDLGDMLASPSTGGGGSMAGPVTAPGNDQMDTLDTEAMGRAYVSSTHVPTVAGPGRRQLWEGEIRDLHKHYSVAKSGENDVLSPPA